MLISKQNSYLIFLRFLKIWYPDVARNFEKNLCPRIDIDGLGECLVCGNDKMLSEQGFFQYALLDDGRIMVLCYPTLEQDNAGNIVIVGIDYSKPYKIIDLTDEFYDDFIDDCLADD